jgi:hypothetical protein
LKAKCYRRAEGSELTEKCPLEAHVKPDCSFVNFCCTIEFVYLIKRPVDKKIENRYWPTMVQYPETLQVTKGLAFLEPFIPKP